MRESGLNCAAITDGGSDLSALVGNTGKRALEKPGSAHHLTGRNYRPGKPRYKSERQFGNFR
jgi:hypothetical protein